MMEQVKNGAPLKGFVSFDEDEETDAEAETLSGTEIPPHIFAEHTQ